MRETGGESSGALTRLFLANTASNLALRVFSALIGLVATRALVDHYGDDRFALLAIAVQISGLLALLAPGLSGAYTREVADRSGRSRPDDLWALFRLGMRLYLGIGLLIGAALFVFGIGGGAGLLSIDADLVSEAGLVFAVAGVCLALRWPLYVFADTLAGLQQYPRLALVRSLSSIGYSLAALLCVVLHGPLYGVLVLQAGVWAAEGLVLRWLARRLLPPPQGEGAASTRELLGSLGRVGGFLALLEIASLVHHQTDVLVLASLVSAPAVTAYVVAAKLHNIVRELLGTLGSALPALVARESASGNEAALEQVVYRGTRTLLAIVVPVSLTAVLFSPDFLRVWMGEGWERWGGWAAAFVAYLALAAMTSFVGQAAVGSARVAPLALIAAGAAVLNVGLSIILAPRFGVGGVIGATLVAYAMALPAQFIFLFPRVGVRRWRFLREVVVPVYPVSAATFGLLWLLKRQLGLIESVVGLLGWGALFGFALAAPLFWTAVDRRDRRRLLDALRRRAGGP